MVPTLLSSRGSATTEGSLSRTAIPRVARDDTLERNDPRASAAVHIRVLPRPRFSGGTMNGSLPVAKVSARAAAGHGGHFGDDRQGDRLRAVAADVEADRAVEPLQGRGVFRRGTTNEHYR